MSYQGHYVRGYLYEHQGMLCDLRHRGQVERREPGAAPLYH